MGKYLFLFVLLICTIFIVSCSGDGPTSPSQPYTGPPSGQSTQQSHKSVWGVWDLAVDTQTWEVTAIPERAYQFTVDVVLFMQPPSGDPNNFSVNVTDFSGWASQGRLKVDVGLRHPFQGLNEFTGFDVYGVVITPNNATGEYDTDVKYSNGVNQPVLLNADGYTRWMNPLEFPSNGTIMRFTPGQLGTPNTSLFTSTINGYKYFADGLTLSADAASFFANPLNSAKRGTFGAGSLNHREYQLQFPLDAGVPQIVFQYAVIAGWVFPHLELSGDPGQLDVPGDFPLAANAAEAILMKPADHSTLNYSGGNGSGNVILDLEIFDWGALKLSGNVPDEIHQIVVEGDPAVIPGGFAIFDHNEIITHASAGSSLISSVVEVEITGCTPQSTDPVPLLITVESESPSEFSPDGAFVANTDRLAAYFMTSVPVGGGTPGQLTVISPNGGETLFMAMSHEITWDPGLTGATDVKLEWSTDGFASEIITIVADTINDGSFIWKPVPVVQTTTARVRVKTVDSLASDTSNGDFSIVLPVWLSFQPEMTFGTGTVNWVDGPVAYPAIADRFSPAISQNTDSSVYVSFYYWDYSVTTFDGYAGSSNGSIWNGSTGYYNSSGSYVNFRSDCNKVAPVTTGHTVQGIAFSGLPGLNYWWIGQYPKPPAVPWHNWAGDGLQANFSGGKFGELGSDTAGYAYLFGDNLVNNKIFVRKTAQPELICPNDCTQLDSAVTEITNNGLVSHSRSYARQGQGVSLLYYTPSGNIMLAETTNAPTNTTWDATETVWNSTGYTGVHSATLCADSSGRLFATWVAHQTAGGQYKILASMRATVNGAWTSPVVVAAAVSDYEDVNISSKPALLPDGLTHDVAVVTWELGGITSAALSPLDLAAFLPSQDASPAGKSTRDSDVMGLTGTYPYDVIFAYSWDNTSGSPQNWEIAIRHADFVTY